MCFLIHLPFQPVFLRYEHTLTLNVHMLNVVIAAKYSITEDTLILAPRELGLLGFYRHPEHKCHHRALCTPSGGSDGDRRAQAAPLRG